VQRRIRRERTWRREVLEPPSREANLTVGWATVKAARRRLGAAAAPVATRGRGDGSGDLALRQRLR